MSDFSSVMSLNTSPKIKMGVSPNNIPPPSYSIEESRNGPPLPSRTPQQPPQNRPQHQSMNNATNQQGSKPEQLSTTKLVGELATRAIGGAYAVAKTGVSMVGEVVTKSSNSSQSQQPQYGQQLPPQQQYAQMQSQHGQQTPQQRGPNQPYPSNQPYYPTPMPQTQNHSPQQQYVAAPMPLSGNQAYPQTQPYPKPAYQQGPTDYWAPTVDKVAWKAVFYFMVIDFPFALFAFVWCTVTMVVGIALLIVFPIGYPLLYLSTLSWRSLAHIHVLLLCPSNEPRQFQHRVYIEPTGVYARQTFPFHRHISDWYSWKCGLYFIFKNFLYSLYTFIYSILIIALIIPLMCLAPMWLMNIKRIYLSKQRGVIKSFG